MCTVHFILLYLLAITIFEELEQLIESLYHHVSTITIEIFNFDISHVRGREPSTGTSKKALSLSLSKYLTEVSLEFIEVQKLAGETRPGSRIDRDLRTRTRFHRARFGEKKRGKKKGRKRKWKCW